MHARKYQLLEQLAAERADLTRNLSYLMDNLSDAKYQKMVKRNHREIAELNAELDLTLAALA